MTKSTVLVLNRNWQAINVRTPQEAFCMMATNVATGLEIEADDLTGSLDPRPSELGTAARSPGRSGSRSRSVSRTRQFTLFAAQSACRASSWP